MINKVDGIGQYRYPEVRNVNVKTNESAMNMDYGQTSVKDPYENAGVIYEPQNAPAQQPQKVQTEERGVKIELSSNATAVSSTAPKEAVVEESFGATVKRIFYSAVDAVKSFIQNLWEGSTTENQELNDENLRSEAVTKGYQTAEERLAELLKQDNRGTLAKNSDLLTYYDRSGHIAKMDPSDKSKILTGTSNDIQL